MTDYLHRKTQDYQQNEIKTSQDVALSRVGSHLYELFFRQYTIKQWAKEPYQLAPSILQRIPLRLNQDDRYFTDPYQILKIGLNRLGRYIFITPILTYFKYLAWYKYMNMDEAIGNALDVFRDYAKGEFWGRGVPRREEGR
jgi:UDP-galactopyranose mutase